MRIDRLYPAVAVLTLFLLFFRLGSLPLLNPDEGRNAGIALEMSQSGEWLVPTYLGAAYLDKPAVFFDSVAASFLVFGPTEWAARLPTTLAALGVLALIFWFASREYDRDVGVIAVLITVTMPLFFVLARTVIFDMPLTLFTTAAIMFNYRAFESRRTTRRWAVAAGLCAGCATLIKGPVGFIIPGLVALIHAVLGRQWKMLWRNLFPVALPAFLILVIPWFVALSLRRPDFPHYGLVVESFQRFTSTGFRREGPWFYYGPVLLGVCFGWSLLFPGGAYLVFRRVRHLNGADRYLLVWTLVVVGFFSLSKSKLPGYALPALPALGLMSARLMWAGIRNPRGGAARVLWASTGMLTLGAVALVAWTFLDAHAPGSLNRIGSLTHGSDYVKIRALFPHFLRFSVGVFLAGLMVFISGNLRTVWLPFLAAGLMLPTIPPSGLVSLAEKASSRALARSIRTGGGNIDVVLLHSFSNGLGFYLGRTPLLVTVDGAETSSIYIPYSLANGSPRPESLIPPRAFGDWLSRQYRPLFLAADAEHSATLDSLAAARGLRVVPLASGWEGFRLTPTHGIKPCVESAVR